MPGGPGDLYALAEEFRDACALALDGTPGGRPDYIAITQGAPAFDCFPSLYVYVGQVGVGDTYPLQPPLQPMQRLSTTGQVDLVSLVAVVLRCAALPQQQGENLLAPSPAEVSAVARECYADLWAVWNSLKNQFRAGTLFPSLSNRREFAFDAALSVPTSGGAAGWMIPVRVQLGGYS